MKTGQFKLYTASAGSGKTYTLVKEYLTLALSSENVSSKDILAVTFTNKAANEMKAKILSYLNGFIIGEPDKNMWNDVIKALNIDESVLMRRSKDLYDNILHNYSDFNISTIDSFVQQIARSFAKELNLPAQYRVLLDDDDLLDGLIQCIDERIGNDDDSITEILTDFVDFQLNEENSLRIDALLREFVTKLLKESAYKKGEILNLNEFLDDKYIQVKESLEGSYKKIKSDIASDIQDIRDFESEFDIATTDYNSGTRGLPSMLIKIEKDVNVSPSSLVGVTISKIFSEEKNWFSKSIDKKSIDEINKSGINVLKLYEKLADDHKKLFYVNLIRKNLYLYALRSTLLGVVNQHISDTNKVHISEFNKRISDILGDCSIPFIYEKIGSRYKHFFIDEFQDTSLLQWHNFLPLVNNGLSENNMSLLVGDAKQAIYRFRSGEVEQIMNLPSIYGAEKNEFYTECENNLRTRLCKKSLEYNFRSKKNIIDFNNSFFKLSKHKLTSEDYRKVYDDLHQKCPKEYSYDGFVRVEIFDMEKFSADGNEKPNKQYKDAVKESIFNDINTLKEKGFALRDIAILVRSNFDGADIAEFLSKKNVPVISSDSILLKSSDKVRLIILTLKCLIDDKNEVDKLALSFYKNICSGVDSYDVEKALKDDFDFDKIYGLRNQSYSIYDLCCSIIRIYGFNIIEDEFLQYFMNLVLEWQNTDNNGIDAFIEHWDKKSDTFFVKITADIDAVQIMTIHKSKGLEFKVVMYPYAYVKVPGNFRGSEKWLLSDEFEMLKNIPNIDSFILPINKSLLGTDLEHHYTEELEKAAFDDFNIMYVAMTRAKELLFVYTNNKAKSDTDENSTDSYNFFVDYFNADNGYFIANSAGERVDVAEKEDVDFIKNSYQLVDNDKSIKYELGNIEYHKENDKNDTKDILELEKGDVPESQEWASVLKFEPDPTMFWAENDNDYSPREWGNLVHDILSQINTIDDADKVFHHYINEGSIDRYEVEKLRKQFGKIVEIKEIKDAYLKDAIVKNEMGILVSGENEEENEVLRPDRYAELDDRVVLIDYKTGEHHEKYNKQMKNYVDALRGMGIEKNIDAYLLYIRKDDEEIDIKPVF
ncbi:MAG: UvrD-helicase domain-containing protein [Bacteroidales bacterium]|nr:UvrD-helicase domain-containing protein [Bacteroidales bacterium]